MKYADLRQDYQKDTLTEGNLPANPFELFEAWFQIALQENKAEANAMVLSTVDADGFPNGRVVLLKDVNHGFVWFTNYESAKGKELASNPYACLTFWWPERERQVRIKGYVEKVSEAESQTYFHSRPLGSQAGAIVSAQSSKISGREQLDKSYENLLQQPHNQKFEKPTYWGGYRLLPSWFEFWQGRSSRLHDRLYYEKSGNNHWKTGRLSP